jgi:predicted AAA+ superfamily ATPase
MKASKSEKAQDPPAINRLPDLLGWMGSKSHFLFGPRQTGKSFLISRIEKRRIRFLLTGSSARKYRRGGVNLLGGRARTRYLHPLQCNATVVNYTHVSNNAQVPRTTVYAYFEILKDTLLLHEVPAWRRSQKRKPLTSSKYYFFDDALWDSEFRP